MSDREAADVLYELDLARRNLKRLKAGRIGLWLFVVAILAGGTTAYLGTGDSGWMAVVVMFGGGASAVLAFMSFAKRDGITIGNRGVNVNVYEAAEHRIRTLQRELNEVNL